MKIAIMSGWNMGSGASVHSELLGKELAKKNEVVVFSFYKTDFHGINITGKDEDYVIRCFSQYGSKKERLNTKALLKKDYDVFIIEDLGMLPIKQLKKIFPKIKKKAKTINVIHDGDISNKKGFYDFDWDAVVCFDKRYKKFLKEKYLEKKIHIIPYPCFPLNLGNKKETRKKLKLPMNKKIVFSFGKLPLWMDGELRVIEKLINKYDILWLIVSKDKKTMKKIKWLKKKKEINEIDIMIRKKDLDIKELYEYLHASDVLIFPKTSPLHVVIASTIFQCLGSLCPIVARDSNFVEMLSKEVFKYKTNKELEKSLVKVFRQGKEKKKLKQAIKLYLNKCSPKIVAEGFKDIFKKIGIKNGIKKIQKKSNTVSR